MTAFVRDLMKKGEDTMSIVILLTAEFQQMDGKVKEGWIEAVGQGIGIVEEGGNGAVGGKASKCGGEARRGDSEGFEPGAH